VQQTKATSKINRNLFWALLVIALGLILLLRGLNVIPAAWADLIDRGWPILPVLVGVALLLDQAPPLRRWSGLIALLVVGLVLAVIISAAYSSRARTQRTDQQAAFDQSIESSVSTLRVVVDGLDNLVEISPTVGDAPRITAEYEGSSASEVSLDYTTEGDTATFTARETRPDALVPLEEVGRGRLRVELPAGVPIELDFRHRGGTVSLNLLGLGVTRLNVDMGTGGLLLSLPDTALERAGEVVVSQGDLTVFVPEGLGLQFTATGATPQYAEGAYLLDPSTGMYIARRFDSATEQTELHLTVGGTLRLE
jgi:hypothetical protein